MGLFSDLRHKITRTALVASVGFATITVNGCDAVYLDNEESLARVQERGEIVVLTTEDPLIYSQSRKSRSGIDYDLLQSFADYYNLKMRFKTLPNEQAVVLALSQGEGDLAAARLKTPDSPGGFLIGPAYEESHLSLFCQKKLKIENVRDLNGKKVALLSKDNNPGIANRLTQLAPGTEVVLLNDQKYQTVFKDLSKKTYDCAIAENISGSYYVRLHTSVENVSPVTDNFSMSWILTPDNTDLLYLMQAWYQKASRDDEIMRIMDRYKAYLSTLDSRDTVKFIRSIREVLPEYRKAFKEAALEHNLPWQLVASVAYQESHWNPDARSFTGVRGLMQLTTDTALHVGIEDRTDPLQSIWGGSKYLRYLIDKMPQQLNQKDRLALALAAYNVGYAHLRDAQKLAERMGRNPYSWHHLREVLPLLADPDYAEQLEYGPARGYETVDFVERVRSFYSLMTVAG
jgi:Predicted soluble lytic transglycosylase fused to an ABC-type amino acid-binding protein